MAFTRRGGGFTYLGLLFIICVLAMTAAMAGVVWSTVQRRENERELVFIGSQFQAAIERYHQRSKGARPQYPRRLEDLLRDSRSPQVHRDLRKLYTDPMTGGRQWGLIRLPDGGIVGVHSLSSRVPFERTFVAAGLAFPLAKTYREWRFIAPSAVDLLGPPATVDAAASAASRRPPQSDPARNAEPVAPPSVEEEAPAPAAAVRPPRQEDYRTRTPEACSRIAAYDQQVCQQPGTGDAEDADRACQDSAVRRAVACSLGDAGPLPPLVRRGN